MMYRLLFLILPLILSCQTADEIIARNLEVTGGYNQWMSLHTVILKGEIAFDINEVYPILIYQKRPNLTVSMIEIDGKNFILEGYNGKKAIQNDFQSGKIIEIADYHPENFDSDLLNYQDKGFKAQLIGDVEIKGVSCYKVALIKNKVTTYYYFNKSNYYLIREEKEEDTLVYSNFKNVEGRLFPFTIEALNDRDQSEFLLQIKSLQINSVIDSKYFNF